MESVFESKEQYLEFIKTWKEATNDIELYKPTFQDFIIYRILKGKDWRVCLSESSRDETKAEAEYIAYKKDPKWIAKHYPFSNITSEMLESARANMEYN